MCKSFQIWVPPGERYVTLTWSSAPLQTFSFVQYIFLLTFILGWRSPVQIVSSLLVAYVLPSSLSEEVCSSEGVLGIEVMCFYEDGGAMVCIKAASHSSVWYLMTSCFLCLFVISKYRWWCINVHVAKTVPSCLAVLRHLRSIRRSVSNAVMQSLVVALVLTNFDFGNATLAGLANQSFVRLQSVLSAAARLIICRANIITWRYF